MTNVLVTYNLSRKILCAKSVRHLREIVINSFGLLLSPGAGCRSEILLQIKHAQSGLAVDLEDTDELSDLMSISLIVSKNRTGSLLFFYNDIY